MNHISPVNHPESALSGSTIEAMIDRAKDLGLEYFSCTDNGNLTGVLKGYTYAKKKDIKLIAGVELFFKDDNCEIINGTESERIKYFKIVIHAKDQKAYQKMVNMSSDVTRKPVTVGENKYPLFNWKDLEELCKENITMCTSNIEGMVSKHLLVNRADLGMKYYEKLRNMVGAENFYPTVVPFEHDKYWDSVLKVKLGDKEVEIPGKERVKTDSKYRGNLAKDVVRRAGGHNIMTHVYINKVEFKVKPEFQEISEPKLHNEFVDLPGGDIQLKANKFVMALASKFGDTNNLLINNYAYYATKEDKVVQDMKLGEDSRIYQSQYMASTEDVQDYLVRVLGLKSGQISMMVGSSAQFASNFDGFELNYSYRLPDPGPDPSKQLVDIIKKVGRMKWDDQRYLTQFREEFELLTQNGVIDLIPYFLPIVDVYDYYKDNGHLTGPARGSAGGFLISYLCGITHIDPIKYGLSSSRFLTLDRVEQGNLPDIDCDLESRIPLVGKDGNSGYLFNKYGNKAAQVSTRTLLRIKSAILDANRFINGGRVEDEVAKLSKGLPNTPQGVNDSDYVFGYEDDTGAHVEGLLEQNDDLQKYAVARPEEWNIVKRALSIARQNSRHACAYLISDAPIEDTVPVFEVGGVKRVTQPEAKQCEWAGLIKYDFLVISALKDINLCMKMVNDRKIKKLNKTYKGDYKLETGNFYHKGEETYIWDLPEDPAVFKMLGDGHTESVFQLNTTSVTPFVRQIKPNNIIDCATITSLVRPGPLDFVDEETGRNMVEEYVERKFGRSVGKIAVLNEMLPETYGVLVFQEQVTKLAKELAGMNVIDSENVRIAVGKKKIKLIQSLKPIFIEGAAKKVGVETATTIWDMMETFAGYGFNKSHAVAYSAVSYACAFLKHHYKLEWWASVLSNADNKEINEVFYKYVKDMVLPPDINTSTEKMAVDYTEGKVRNKLSMVSGLGTKAAEKIIAGRPYVDIKDFVKKKVCGPSMTKKLAHVGVLDSLFGGETKLANKIHIYEQTVNDIKHEEKVLALEVKVSEGDTKAIKRLEKLKTTGPKPAEIDPMYMGMTPKQDFLIKKSIFPTMNLDLQNVLGKDSNALLTKSGANTLITNKYGRDQKVYKGENLQAVDNNDMTSDIYFCVPGYVIDSSVFTYAGGAKKALKIIIDSSGYISEKVLWADYDTGELLYPDDLKKGCIAYFFYGKKAGKPYTNINEIIIEEKSIL